VLQMKFLKMVGPLLTQESGEHDARKMKCYSADGE
jgi:hypothetical protein